MKEISDIIKSYEAARISGRKMALATVVHVEGSSYRRPGARMLVTDDGLLTGAISGGCLEGDALRKALLAISQGKNKLVTYDTTDESDPMLGVQLGCNGIVHILFEPIDIANPENPVALLKKVAEKRQYAVVITLFALHSRTAAQPGTCFLQLENDAEYQAVPEQAGLLTAEATRARNMKQSDFRQVEFRGQQFTAFVEYLAPAPSLVIVGAGNDTIPLMQMASVLGWKITVVDGRPAHATIQRFPTADQVIVARAEDVLTQIEPDERTFFTLMTHNYNYDLTLLAALIREEKCHYIGALGPKKKLERMFSDLAERNIVLTPEQKSKIYGPIGLDIGAETSEEIALAVLAEIKAVLEGKNGTSLREKADTIHSRHPVQQQTSASKVSDFACAIQTAELS
ncbi:XdhC family protein [Dyadobacter sandarakinus]|uniref:XdhC family protein n=1 Tax=Dyadobacter sandarakinus TaxID=2747268 RepID=A0ABX7I7P3_9BACT|nr:XdhC/CoxI family protein [Dyadobacter sandarakinus]QRR01582.1 XdhC family protein [Dyadobacter sandarakinus]